MVAADAIRHAFGDNLPPLDFLVDIVLVPDFFEEDFGEDFGEDFEDPLVAGAGAPPLDFDFLLDLLFVAGLFVTYSGIDMA